VTYLIPRCLLLLVAAAAIGGPVAAETIPAAPPNVPAEVRWNAANGALRLVYNGEVILDGRIEGGAVELSKSEITQDGIEQHLKLSGKDLRLTARAHGSEQMIAAETRGEAQKKFPIVRTSHGMSANLRNNVVYDRKWDRQLEILAPGVRITPAAETATARDFALIASGDLIEIVFRPHFYQKQQGIANFEPWTYKVREDSITGWCSWFAFKRSCSQKNCDELLAVWKAKHLADYGYKFIQLDDCFQSDLGKGESTPQYPGVNRDYPSRGPDTWLKWRKDNYPAGIEGYAAACKNSGFEPGIWIGLHVTDNEVITKHPDWFIRGKDGKPFIAPWISCAIDSTNKEAMDTMVRPTFAGVRKSGFPYVKIDLLRHYFYDNLNNNPDYCKEHGVTSQEMFRNYLGAARKELGPDTFILSCWGVLPESAGLADACRIAGDGYGPVSMQQYNAWNGIVWRNDPDVCDVFPQFKGVGTGNVTRFEKSEVVEGDTVIRPALASIAGAMLILGDRPDVYRDDRNIEGSKRSSPVIFSVPGQLYNFDERKSNVLKSTPRESIKWASDVIGCDADQHGTVCPWWLNEFNLRDVGQWSVLHRVNWGAAAPATTVAFADLGLEADADYLVYEFWTHSFVGIKRGHIDLPATGNHELRSYALRKLESHPQIVSTNRHLSQGGVDLVAVNWKDGTLSGTSNVVTGDSYELAVHMAAGFKMKTAAINGMEARTSVEGELLRISFVPATTGKVEWKIAFTK